MATGRDSDDVPIWQEVFGVSRKVTGRLASGSIALPLLNVFGLDSHPSSSIPHHKTCPANSLPVSRPQPWPPALVPRPAPTSSQPPQQRRREGGRGHGTERGTVADSLVLCVDYPAWAELQKLYDAERTKLVLKDLFASDPARFTKYSRTYVGPSKDVEILVDMSKNLIDGPVFNTLLQLAAEAKVEQARDDMFAGKHINTSEDRAVLHIALRNVGGEFKIPEAGTDEVQGVIDHMTEFSNQVRDGKWLGYTGKAIKSIVNIGIGGSDLGPVMVTEALKSYSKRDLAMHFVSNVDGTHIVEVTRECDPETTLFIIASKTFTTQETLTNAESAREWFLKIAVDVRPSLPFSFFPSELALLFHFGSDRS